MAPMSTPQVGFSAMTRGRFARQLAPDDKLLLVAADMVEASAQAGRPP